VPPGLIRAIRVSSASIRATDLQAATLWFDMMYVGRAVAAPAPARAQRVPEAGRKVARRVTYSAKRRTSVADLGDSSTFGGERCQQDIAPEQARTPENVNQKVTKLCGAPASGRQFRKA
jgi:hypothetical protein